MFSKSSLMQGKEIGSGLITGNLLVQSVLSPFDGSKYFILEVQHRKTKKMCVPSCSWVPSGIKLVLSVKHFLEKHLWTFCPMSSSPVTAPRDTSNSELGLHVFTFSEPFANLMSPCFSLPCTFYSSFFFLLFFKNNFRKNQVYSTN